MRTLFVQKKQISQFFSFEIKLISIIAVHLDTTQISHLALKISQLGPGPLVHALVRTKIVLAHQVR